MNFPKKILGENMSLSIENISTLWSTAEIIVNSFRAEKGINIIQIFYTLLLRIWLKERKFYALCHTSIYIKYKITPVLWT